MVLLSLHLHPRISIVTSPDSSHHDVLSSMRFGLTQHFPLRRSFADYSVTSGLKSTVTMATTESENLVKTSTEETSKKKEEETSKNKKEEVSISLPPPPEKPEPGDCCGSGCVRCVWDVYYEELEDYNNKLSAETNESD